MNKKPAKLTDTDWILLKALWDKPHQTMGQIVQTVQKTNSDIRWSYKTYHTYLNNLCSKEFAAYDIHNAKSDRLYYALISREEAVTMESEALLTRVSGDHLTMLIATLARNDQLSPDEQKELMALADKLESEKGRE